jgi:WXXGXW repeat (2 copies)
MHMLSKFGASATVALTLAMGVAGCNKQPDSTAQTQDQQDPNVDPASANMAPADQSAPVNESATAAAPVSRSSAPVAQPSSQPATSASDNVPPPPPDESVSTYPSDNTVPATEVSSDQSSYYDAAAVEQPVYAPQPPPPLPVYEQPICPGPNYMWTPGYWGYQPTGYYWVPGVWVIAPYVGALWTPGYWGWFGGRYGWNRGYWGPHIGYYGGINYGHGYAGRGYDGGYWNHDSFYYNRSITNVNTTVVRNVYVHNVTINNYNNNRVSYTGGQGGIQARPTPSELQASRERHLPPLTTQTMHARQAGQDRAQFYSVNQGRPQTVALTRPLATPFHAPAAQPPVRGVANPGFSQRTAVNNQVNRPQVPQQHPEARPDAVSTVRPQQPNLIRPQTHPQNTVHPEARPTEARQVQPRPQPEQARAPQELHPAPRQEPQQMQQEKPRAVVQQQQPRAPQEMHPAPHQQPEQRPESRPQEPHEDHPHSR